MPKVSSDQIATAYLTSKSHFQKGITKKDAISHMNANGINIGYAGIFLQIFEHLKNGEKFTRTTSGESFNYFLENLLIDFGSEQLKVSLSAFKKHIIYLENKYNINRPLFWNIYNKYNDLLSNEEGTLETDDEEVVFLEGAAKYKLHLYKERNRALIKLAKSKYLERNNKLNCQACDFSFQNVYGEVGKNFIEAHHIYPISQLTSETTTKIEDIVFVCSNCHRMLHRKRPWMSLADLKSLILKIGSG
jgi:predicted HNH restriction endonuclease